LEAFSSILYTIIVVTRCSALNKLVHKLLDSQGAALNSFSTEKLIKHTSTLVYWDTEMSQNTTQTQNTKLYDFLIENNFYISPQLADIIETVMKTKRKAFLLRGPAGTGKTQLTYLISQWLGAEYVFFQCTYGTSEEELLYKYIPSEESKSGIRITLGPIPRALSISKTRKVVLVLDEFDKTRPSADALLLDVLQNVRVSLYIDEKETVVVGNPENLVIFLTSNEMREFSEPLLRRVITITLQPLPPEKVYELLSKRFSKEVSLLLTQIYADTINAGLRKPATIQELYQLGEVLEAGMSLPLEDLLKTFVIKYDDDWKKYREYVISRRPYEFTKKEEQREEIEKYYEPSDVTEIEISKDDAEKSSNSATSVLEKLKKFNVKRVEVVAEPIKVDSSETIEVTLKVPDNDFETYTHIVKNLKPEASDNPAVFGKFKYIADEMNVIISEEPLTIREAFTLSSLKNAETYYEDIVLIKDKDISKIIDSAKKIKYYTKNKMYLESDEPEEKVVIERVSDVSVRVRGYFKSSEKHEPVLLQKLKGILDHNNLEMLTDLLCTPRGSVFINLSNIPDGSYQTDNISATAIVNIIENLRKSNISNNTKFSVGEANYNYYIIKEKDTLIVGLGYRYFDIVKTVEEVKKGYRCNINDSIVDKVVEALKRG